MTTTTKYTPRRIARKLYKSSPQTLVGMASRRSGKARKRFGSKPPPITVDFLRSDRYQQMMNLHVPYDGEYGLHEAQTTTKSFNHRAFEVDHILRAYRWRGIQEHLDEVLELVTSDGLVADLGGAGSPFGLGSVVVDQLPVDADGNQVRYRSLDDLPEPCQAILSSHTLEHIPELEAELARIRDSLAPGGRFMALLPAFSCERWRAGNHSHAAFGDHVWTFGLSGTPGVPEGLVSYVEADKLFADYFTVETATYCGDDSIFLVCRRD